MEPKKSLDKDLAKLVRLELATRSLTTDSVSTAIALLFLIGAGLVAALFAGVQTEIAIVVFAAVLGGYMALNIGANDVANNVGPAVGSKSMTLIGTTFLITSLVLTFLLSLKDSRLSSLHIIDCSDLNN